MTPKTILPLENGSKASIEQALGGHAIVYQRMFTSKQYVIPYQSFNLIGNDEVPDMDPPVYKAHMLDKNLVLEKVTAEAYYLLREADALIMSDKGQLYISDSLDEKLLNEPDTSNSL
ncbi:MAG: hypothetical protein ACLFTH_02575 [Candidatus Woesearchaeota archaeon]